MTRLIDWEPRLTAYMAAFVADPVDPKSAACALFTAGAVKAQTGVDYAVGWRKACRSLAAGRRALKKAGFEDHVAFVAAHLDPVAPARAQRGDVAVVAEGDVLALGIVQGEVIYVVASAGGLGMLPRSRMIKAFRV